MSYHYDRTGERVEDAEPQVHECDDGWVDTAGGVSPCPRCRPEAHRRLLQRVRERRSAAVGKPELVSENGRRSA